MNSLYSTPFLAEGTTKMVSIQVLNDVYYSIVH